MKSNFSFPTYFGVISLVVLLSVLSLINRRLTLGSKATAGITPKETKITNVSSNSFTISWKTEKPSSGMIKVFFPEERLFNDVRDVEKSSRGEYFLHYILIDGLLPGKTYSFWINSNGRFYGSDGEIEGKKFSVKTAPVTADLPLSAELAYGQVIDAQGKPVEGALVYLDIPQLAPLSGLTASSGYWVIPLAFAFNPSLTQVANYQEGEIKEQLLVEAGPLGKSLIVNFTKNNKPVPPITIGKDADFSQLSVSPASNQQGKEKGKGYLPPYYQDGKKESEFKLLNPEDGEGISTSRPEIFGTGPKGKTVEIVIESPVVYRGEVVIGSDGEWRWSPPDNLSPGEHQVTVKLKDENGEVKSFLRKFVVLAAGDGTAFTATPSGGAVSPTPTLILTPTSSPSATVALTPTPTPTPTLALTPVATITEIPQTGSSEFLVATLLGGGVTLLAGLIFALF